MADKSTETTAVALNGRKCLVPSTAYRPEAAKANSYTCPIGPAFGRAWVLMLRRDLEAMKKKGELDKAVTLDMASGKRALHFPRLYFVKATNVSGGPKNSRDAAYLCELVDVRYALMHATIDFSFNVVKQIGGEDFNETAASSGSESGAADAGGVTRYVYGTTAFGSDNLPSRAWTWQELFSAIWPCVEPLGAEFVHRAFRIHKLVLPYSPPQIPFAPAGVPENYIFHRANAWKAYNDLLAKFCWALAYNPVGDDFSIVRMGAVQPGLVRVESRLVPMYDADPIEPKKPLGPGHYFASAPMQLRHHGLESGDQWRTHAASGHLNDHPTSNTPLFAAAGQSFWNIPRAAEQLWDNGPVPYETYPANDPRHSRAERLAAERVRQMVDGRRQDLAMPLARRLYSGIVPTIIPGERVKCISWRQSAGDGVVTEVIQHPGLPRMGDSGEWLGREEAVRVDGMPDVPGCGSPVHPPVTYLFGLSNTRILTAGLHGDGGLTAGWNRSWKNSGYFLGQFVMHDPIRGESCNDSGSDTNLGDRRYFNADGLAPYTFRYSWDGNGSIPYQASFQYCWVRFVDCPTAPAFVRFGGFGSQALDGYLGHGRLNGTHTIDRRTFPLLLAENRSTQAPGTVVYSSGGTYGVLLAGGGNVAVWATAWHVGATDGTGSTGSSIVDRYRVGDKVWLARIGCEWVIVNGAMPGKCGPGNLIEMCTGTAGANALGGNESGWENVTIGDDGEIILNPGDGEVPLDNFGGELGENPGEGEVP